MEEMSISIQYAVTVSSSSPVPHRHSFSPCYCQCHCIFYWYSDSLSSFDILQSAVLPRLFSLLCRCLQTPSYPSDSTYVTVDAGCINFPILFTHVLTICCPRGGGGGPGLGPKAPCPCPWPGPEDWGGNPKGRRCPNACPWPCIPENCCMAVMKYLVRSQPFSWTIGW